MKIAIGTNIFGVYPRQTLAIESLKLLQEKVKKLDVDIDLYNIQFENNTINVDGFKTLNSLKNNNITIRSEIIKASGYCRGCTNCDGIDNNIPFSSKVLPLMSELFDSLGNLTGYDYVIFTNSDVMISDRLISEIINTKKESYSVSRIEIHEIKSLTDPMVPFKIEAAGFDTYIFKPEWWQKNKFRFPKYLLGVPSWDNHYTSIFMAHSDSKILNYYPGHIIHMFHGYGSHQDTVENRYGHKLWDRHAALQSGWGTYFDEIISKRTIDHNVMFGGKNEFEDDLTAKIFNITKKLDNNEINGFVSVLKAPDNLQEHNKMKLYIKSQLSNK